MREKLWEKSLIPLLIWTSEPWNVMEKVAIANQELCYTFLQWLTKNALFSHLNDLKHFFNWRIYTYTIQDFINKREMNIPSLITNSLHHKLLTVCNSKWKLYSTANKHSLNTYSFYRDFAPFSTLFQLYQGGIHDVNHSSIADSLL